MKIAFALLSYQIINIAADQISSRIQNGSKTKFVFPGTVTCRLEKLNFSAVNRGRTMNCECDHDKSVRIFHL
jgi:hypothetical protein